MANEPRSVWSRSVVRVGGGRRFVVETERKGRFVITAAHCLPKLPPAHPGAFPAERTCPKLIGRLGGQKTTVWAECVFADPVADLAVLASPNDLHFGREAKAYETRIKKARPLPIGRLTFVSKTVPLLLSGTMFTIPTPPTAESDAWVLSLDGRWFSCRVGSHGRAVEIIDSAEPIERGMSGTPIVAPGGAAIGVISLGVGINPELAADLPAWMLRITGCLPT